MYLSECRRLIHYINFFMMKVLILGGNGMLGHKLVQVFSGKFDVWTTLRDDFDKYKKFEMFDREKTVCGVDAEKFETVKNAIEYIKPNLIINAIGVIKQLPSSNNVVKTLTINSIFPHLVAETAQKISARFIEISTDCVFNGKKGNYTESDLPDAYDLYGKSKNLGEITGGNCLTLRTSIIGRELLTANSLVDWFLSNRGKTVKGYKNAVYSGFPTIVLAEIIADLLVNKPKLSGLYHVSSEPINKFDLLCLIRDAYKIDIEIEQFEDFSTDKSLNSDKFRYETNFIPKTWQEMIAQMANDKTPYDEWKK
jgi:dTDP-4-dehydrorhamnose reductase